MYTGPTVRPAALAAAQSVYPSAFAETSLVFPVSQQTCELAIPESTGAVGKVPFCFSVIRTHLYFSEDDVPVYGEVLATYVPTLPGGGAVAVELHGVPRGTVVSPANVSWQNSSSK